MPEISLTDNSAEWLHGKKLVLLVGSPRSGTTWLQLLLSRSPLVATSQETDLFNIFLRPMVEEWTRCRETGETVSISEVLGEEGLRSLLLNISSIVFAMIAHSKPQAKIVLEKTPQHVRYWREILDLWPNAHFIHIIRDPRSVVASLRAAAVNWGPPWGSSRISRIAKNWVSDVCEGLRIRSATGNYLQVSYEELSSDSDGVLRQILGTLGVPASCEECRRYVEECSIEKLKASQLDNAPFDLTRQGRYRFRIGETESWRTELSKWEIALVENTAGSLMSELGFASANNSAVMSAVAEHCCAATDVVNSGRRLLRRVANRLRPP